jgi:hypothetical protein
MPAIVWLPMYDGYLLQGYYQLSRSASGFWSTRELPDGPSDRVRLFNRGADLFLGYRDDSGMLNIARAPSASTVTLSPTITVPGPTAPLDTLDELLNNVEDYDVARDAGGTLHLVVYDSADDGAEVLTYYRKSGTSPATQGPTPVKDGRAGAGVSLVLGPGDKPTMSYYAAAIGGIRVSALGGTAWSHEDLDTTGIGGRSRVRFDGSGQLHVAYEDVAIHGVKLIDEVCP